MPRLNTGLFGAVFAVHTQTLTPYIHAVDHREEIVDVDADLPVETMGVAKIRVYPHLRKTEEEIPDIPLRRQYHVTYAQTSA